MKERKARKNMKKVYHAERVHQFDDTKSEAMERLNRWFCTEVNIGSYNSNFIRNFLVNCNYSERECQKKLYDYFFYKKTYPEYMQAGNLTNKRFLHFCNSVFSLYMPVLTKEGYQVFIDKITDDENLFDVRMIMQYYCMQTDLRYLKNLPDNGDIILFDCNHVNLLNFVAFLPYFVKSLSLVLKIYPLNLRQFILVNTGKLVEIIFNFTNYFIPGRYKKLVQVYAEGKECFLLHVDPDVLPSDYGGKLTTLEEIRTNLIEELISKQEWFQMTNIQINATTLVFSPQHTAAFGPSGTFKRLQID